MTRITVAATDEGKAVHARLKLNSLLTRLRDDWSGMSAEDKDAFQVEVLECVLMLLSNRAD